MGCPLRYLYENVGVEIGLELPRCDFMEKLTIVIFSYNHEKFLRRTLESILMQKVNFSYRILVADDASTDSSPAIISEYAEKHPGKVVPLLRPQNLGSMENYRRTLADVRSEYVLVNDGDDYLIDPSKLQRQVDWLDEHPEYSICFHSVQVVREGDEAGSAASFPVKKYCRNMDFRDLLEYNFLQTNAVMYRWAFNDGSLLSQLPGDILPGDHFLHLLHAERGRIGYIPGEMSAYLRHSSSLWAGDAQSPGWFERCAEPHIRFYKAVEKRFNCSKLAQIQFMEMHLQLVRGGSPGKLRYLWYVLMSKITAGQRRYMYKSLKRMAKHLM